MSEAANVYCPAPLTVADAQRLTRFKAGPGRDPRDIAFEAALIASGATCELNRNQLNVNLIMRISVNAGPSVGAGTTQVPYFVRVINNSGGVVQSQEFTADFRLTTFGQSTRYLAGGTVAAPALQPGTSATSPATASPSA